MSQQPHTRGASQNWNFTKALKALHDVPLNYDDEQALQEFFQSHPRLFAKYDKFSEKVSENKKEEAEKKMQLVTTLSQNRGKKYEGQIEGLGNRLRCLEDALGKEMQAHHHDVQQALVSERGKNELMILVSQLQQGAKDRDEKIARLSHWKVAVLGIMNTYSHNHASIDAKVFDALVTQIAGAVERREEAVNLEVVTFLNDMAHEQARGVVAYLLFGDRNATGNITN